jgi:hypothetical protein
MATFGNKIAATCDDGTVAIYDSVTGVLRLSFSLADPVQAIRGSPDGSVLFCAHKTPSITVWDMQTGGLIHTFDLERNAEDIAVSSKGRYLACGLSDRSVEVWEVTKTMESGAIWTSSPVTSFCWLEPEDCLMVSTGTSMRIWDVVVGTILHSYTSRYPVDRMVYSQKFNQLAIMSISAPGSAMTVINPHTDSSTTSHWNHQNISCFAFSRITEELVCGKEKHGLQLFNISKRLLKHIEHPDTVTSVSSLQNGTVVANFAGSGIQLLSLDAGHTLPQQQAISPLTVHAFDQDKIIAIFPTSRDHIVLLESVTMSQLLKIPVQDTPLTPTDHTILCASFESRVAVYYFVEGVREFMQLWGFHAKAPRWTVKVDGVPQICRISPTGVRLATLHTNEHRSRICLWDAQNGQLDAQLEDIPAPLTIEFASDTKFFTHDGVRRTTYKLVRSEGVGIGIKQDPPGSEFALLKWPQRRNIDVDNTHEWVVSGEKRVCWIPPGYIGSIEPSYWWAGYLLVMVGQDGVLRNLAFQSQSEW